MGALARDVKTAILGLPFVAEHPSQWATRPAFWVDGRQFAELLGPDAVQLRLTRRGIGAQRARLKSDPRVEVGTGDWITVRFTRRTDLALVVELATLAADANRRGDGDAARPMPDDRELARRRKRHRAATDDLAP